MGNILFAFLSLSSLLSSQIQPCVCDWSWAEVSCSPLELEDFCLCHYRSLGPRLFFNLLQNESIFILALIVPEWDVTPNLAFNNLLKFRWFICIHLYGGYLLLVSAMGKAALLPCLPLKSLVSLWNSSFLYVNKWNFLQWDFKLMHSL